MRSAKWQEAAYAEALATSFTAETLGTERAGNGVLIRDGVVLTIGYLITEAQTIWLHPADGHVAIDATVTVIEPLGAETHVVLDAAGTRLVARAPGFDAPAAPSSATAGP